MIKATAVRLNNPSDVFIACHLFLGIQALSTAVDINVWRGNGQADARKIAFVHYTNGPIYVDHGHAPVDVDYADDGAGINVDGTGECIVFISE